MRSRLSSWSRKISPSFDNFAQIRSSYDRILPRRRLLPGCFRGQFTAATMGDDAGIRPVTILVVLFHHQKDVADFPADAAQRAACRRALLMCQSHHQLLSPQCPCARLSAPRISSVSITAAHHLLPASLALYVPGECRGHFTPGILTVATV